MSAYDEILKMLRKEVKNRNFAFKIYKRNVDSDAAFGIYSIYAHSVRMLKLALAAIRKERDERK